MKEKSDMYQIISTFKSESWSYVRQFEAKNTGFTWCVEHRGEDIDLYIPDYVDKTGLVCPDCKHIC